LLREFEGVGMLKGLKKISVWNIAKLGYMSTCGHRKVGIFGRAKIGRIPNGWFFRRRINGLRRAGAR
jgi:GTP cyclohydrolase I